MVAHADMVYVPVPSELYIDVIGFIADNAESSSGVEPVADEPVPEIDESLVRRIFAESQDTHRRLLKILADQAGEWVPYTEISAKMGYATPRSLPGTLGAFGRRAKHRYGGAWPFDVEWDHDIGWRARMDLWIADIIREL